MIQAAFLSANTSIILFALFVLIQLEPADEYSWQLFVGAGVALGTIWVIAFIFSMILLLPLKPLSKVINNSISLSIFIVVGFSVPALLLTVFSSTPTHGEAPVLSAADNSKVVWGIFSVGLIGGGSALAAWISLYKNRNSLNKKIKSDAA